MVPLVVMLVEGSKVGRGEFHSTLTLWSWYFGVSVSLAFTLTHTPSMGLMCIVPIKMEMHFMQLSKSQKAGLRAQTPWVPISPVCELVSSCKLQCCTQIPGL